jgi:inorganic pyrophosphatase
MTYDPYRRHPWHGLPVGKQAPRLVHAFIEITPFDLVKYELDKENGYLRVDRPQRTSSQPPVLYGFVPRTYCAERVQALCPGAARGDGDPLDICVLSERPIARAEVLLDVKVVGGLQMLDGGEADDKIIAVLHNDTVWAGVEEVGDLPEALVERIRHYFLTYKLVPGTPSTVQIDTIYGRDHAQSVVAASMADYDAHFGGT